MRLSLAVTKTYSDWPMTIYNNHTMIDQLPFETNRYEQDANKNISKTKKKYCTQNNFNSSNFTKRFKPRKTNGLEKTKGRQSHTRK